MRFIVCARNRSDGETFVVGQRSYPDKDAAISALGGSSSLEGLAECELFVLDLDAATPVVLVRARQEPVADASVEPDVVPHDDATCDDEPADVVPDASGDEEIGERLEESDLWSIVETITDEPLDAAPVADGAPTAPWWIDAAPSEDVVQVSIYDYTDDVGSEPVAEHTAVTAEEAGRDARAENGGEAADVRESDAWAEAGVAEMPDETPPLEPGSTTDRPVDEPFDDARLSAEPLPDVIETPESDPGVMRVDFDAWTCVDCVFTTTCEHTDDESPSDCGSFQWRPA